MLFFLQRIEGELQFFFQIIWVLERIFQPDLFFSHFKSKISFIKLRFWLKSEVHKIKSSFSNIIHHRWQIIILFGKLETLSSAKYLLIWFASGWLGASSCLKVEVMPWKLAASHSLEISVFRSKHFQWKSQNYGSFLSILNSSSKMISRKIEFLCKIALLGLRNFLK